MTDRLVKITTALAMVAVAVVAAIISYQHAYKLVRSHGESGMTARLLPFTVDGLIWAASMVVLDASRRNLYHGWPRRAWALGSWPYGSMRSIVVTMWVTLDGVVQGLGRPDEDTRGGFTHGGWARGTTTR